MHPSYKNDPSLGKEVHAYLVKQGLETPMTDQVKQSAEKKIAAITDSFSDIMIELGLDTTDDSLMDTPKRVAKMYVNEIFYGLNYDYFPKCTAIENKMKTNGSFLLEKNINVQSNCEHHFVVIDGLATVAYIADKKLLGLSKLNRIVQFFAKRPQVQERLTEQIRATIQYVAQTDDVAVYVDAKHWCVKSRGIQDQTSSTVTLSVGGVFADKVSEIRKEFLNLARSG
jgi:GTP cyclohydrolase I|tara:strand:+ start:68 stop:748 length:681 start_codon:yes stop_codon:yes gene_type:complete